ncbi:ROK family transcriptional regulator [Variovorax paradoxus]|nr:ROK family transcriptional regulator [Variovorax paradoxus]
MNTEGTTVKGQLLQLIRDRGPMSRSELARRLELSATTVTRVVNDLEADKVLIEGAALAPTGAGRPAITLHIRADACLVAAVQVGIGVVHIGIFNARAERRSESHFGYSIGASPESVLRRIADGISALCESSGVSMGQLLGVGVAVPGPVDAAGRRMLMSIRLHWRNVAIAEELEAATGLSVTVEHNVRSMALAEARFGQGRGLGSVAFVYLRSGLGAGLVVRGQPFSGGVHGAVELGHLAVIDAGAVCVCGGRGCIETVLSESALKATTERLRIAPKPDALSALWSAAQRRKDAMRAIDAIVTPLATGLSALTTLLNPELVLLGGALADIPDALFDRIVEATWRGAFPLIRESIRIERSQLGTQAGLAGAATVALDHFLYA